MGEFNIYGVYVPILLVFAILSYGLLRLAMLGLDRVIEKGWIPLPSLFYLCIYMMILAAMQWGYVVCFA
jgi:hypothetical protein